MSHEPTFLKAPAERMIELLMGNRIGNLIWFRWEGSCRMKVSCKSLCCRDVGKGEAEGPRHPLPVHHQHFLKVYLIYLFLTDFHPSANSTNVSRNFLVKAEKEKTIPIQ